MNGHRPTGIGHRDPFYGQSIRLFDEVGKECDVTKEYEFKAGRLVRTSGVRCWEDGVI